MSRNDVSERAAALRADRVPYVHVRVVLAERPTSAKPGDEALVLGDGSMEGFVGGTCAETTVRSQSLALLDSGDTELLRITPDPEGDQPGKRVVHNPCLSGGTLELFLEPVMPPPLVLVAGDAPIARALLSLGASLGYDLQPFGSVDLAGSSGVVVASHGRDEEAALSAALEADVPYIGLVASKTRGHAVLSSLGDDAVARVRSPAGLDIGARTAEEVALSILAEVVSVRPRPTHAGEVAGAAPIGEAIDPVCGMTVATAPTSLHLEHDGATVWFCGSGCLRAFADNPAAITAP
ncbi:MAG: xanthine dehydrogenase accessory factor [Actinomycetota bacterium]|jgi:xanthine dehydrogenase accessory factor|nr:xanthine dehydrogenase accessory factor [Actinomycetota bacterium]